MSETKVPSLAKYLYDGAPDARRSWGLASPEIRAFWTWIARAAIEWLAQTDAATRLEDQDHRIEVCENGKTGDTCHFPNCRCERLDGAFGDHTPFGIFP